MNTNLIESVNIGHNICSRIKASAVFQKPCFLPLIDSILMRITATLLRLAFG